MSSILSKFTRKTPSTPDLSASQPSFNTSSPMLTLSLHSSHHGNSQHNLPSQDTLHQEFLHLQKFDNLLQNNAQFSKRVLQRYSNVGCVEWSRVRLVSESQDAIEQYRTKALGQLKEYLKDMQPERIIQQEFIPEDLARENAETEIVHANVIRARDLNAFMDEYEIKTDFLVGHAPLKEELPAFVNCLIRYKVPLVAVLARTVENGRQKVHQWWPDKRNTVVQCDTQGQIRIELLGETKHEAFTERRLRCHMRGESHDFVMIHYENWPDFGIPQPKDFISMADFINGVLDQVPLSQRKLYVHCSAGIGRTSTLVSSLILHEQARYHLASLGESTGNQTFSIHLPLIIRLLKYHRPGMTQTAAQYSFSFEFILREIQEKYPNVRLKHEGISAL